MEQNTFKRKKKIVFVGGGPATMGFVCYLQQRSKARELFFNNFEMTILEKTQSFGAGNLGEYGINCNIPAHLFTSGIRKNIKDNIYDDKLGENFTYNIFESSLHKYLKIQKYTISFPLITRYLESLGNYLISRIYPSSGRIFHPLTQVEKIIQREDKLFDIYYTSLKDGSENIITADYLVLANGGMQKPPEQMILNYIESINKMEHFYYSDYIYRIQGYTHIKEKLNSMKKAKILIVGGSNSAFSAAGILLYGIIEEKDFIEKCKYVYSPNPYCTDCKRDQCCFGKLRDNQWKGMERIECEMEITVIYRDFIKVCYDSPEEAIENNYYDFDSTSIDRNNKIYTLVGLRGDCKDLYLQAKSGQEKRVKIEKAKNFEEQKPFFDSHDIIIWACGYQTRRLDLTDYTGTPIEFDCDDGLAHIEKYRRPFVIGKGIIENLFGIGKSFPEYAEEFINGKPGRGDVIKRFYTRTPHLICEKLFEQL